MKVLLDRNINDFEEVKSALNSVEIGESDIDQLIEVLSKSNNILVCNMIAFRLKKFKANKIHETLIAVISRPDNFNKRGKLIHCCSEYDCTRHFDLFLKIILEEDGESCINAIDIISEMKGPFSHRQLSKAVNEIENHIKINRTKDKIPYLAKLNKHLNELLNKSFM